MFTWDALMKALDAGADTLDALVRAAGRRGRAERASRVTNEIIEICDGGSAYVAQLAMIQRVKFCADRQGRAAV